jgi:hypothetical protein
MAVTIGTQLGSLEVTALLGKGGMGEVYRARDAKLKPTSRSKSCPTNSRVILLVWAGFNAKRNCSRP